MNRESMEYDVVIVGAGPAGLATAIKIKQLANEASQEISVCLLEKGAEVGAHILSGAILETRALDELLPNWKEDGAPINTAAEVDEILMLTSAEKSIKIPNALAPKSMHNHGNYIISLGRVCNWMAEQAEALEVDIFPGFAVAEVLYNEDGSVKGVATGDMGVGKDGSEKPGYTPGMELHARYTVFSEGCRGHLGKELIERFELAKDSAPQHYGIGIKEMWKIPAEQHKPGTVVHGAGWPLSENNATGGFFLYHGDNGQVAVGLITDLNYSNPYLSPYEEFQKLKHHPVVAEVLKGGERLAYGARAIAKGGLHSLPKMTMPGAILVGCDAGTLNSGKIKGSHTAMKSGMLAAESIMAGFALNEAPVELTDYEDRFKNSWLHKELSQTRNFSSAIHRWGNVIGGGFNFLEQLCFPNGSPFKLREMSTDHGSLKPAKDCTPINYAKPDGVLSFDKPSSVFLSNAYHDEDQPVHLTLKNSAVPISTNLPIYDAPEQRYCPAGVYEIIDNEGSPELQINAQNCVHCKTCDIKDPTQNIRWVTPEGTGGPNYQEM